MKPSINRFGALAGLVKKVKRTGWLRYLPQHQVESVGDHSAKIAFLSLYLRDVKDVDYVKCVQMALIHDIAQGIVGDFTPYCKITPEEKSRREEGAVHEIFKEMGEQNKEYFVGLWLEYERGETYDAKIVKDLDKLQMIQQAYEYEKEHKVKLTQFYECVTKMKTDIIKKWAQELLEERNSFVNSL